MYRLISLAIVLITLTACTTEQVAGPVDAERASEANTQLGLGYMQQNRLELAMKKLEKAVAFDPNNAKAHQYKAELHRRLKQFDKAKEHFEIAMSLSKNDPILFNNYGVFLCEIKEYDRATKHFNNAINDPLYPNKDEANENLGLCALSKGDLYQAEESFRKALQLNSKLPKSLVNLAQIHYDRHDIKTAYQYYARFLPLAQQTPNTLWLGYLLEKSRGNMSAASSYAINLKGKYPDARETDLLKNLEARKEK